MYTLGFIKTERPDVLINPVECRSTEEIYNWLIRFFNPEDFFVDTQITEEKIAETVKSDKPSQINLNGYQVALLFGKTKIVEEATTRYIHLMPRSNDSVDVSKIDNLSIPD